MCVTPDSRQESLFRKSRTSSLRGRRKIAADSIDSPAAKSNYAFCHFSACDYLEAHVLVSFPFSALTTGSKKVPPSLLPLIVITSWVERQTEVEQMRMITVFSPLIGRVDEEGKEKSRGSQRYDVRKSGKEWVPSVCHEEREEKMERKITMHTLPSSFRRFCDQYFVYWNVFLFKCLSLRIGMGWRKESGCEWEIFSVVVVRRRRIVVPSERSWNL